MRGPSPFSPKGTTDYVPGGRANVCKSKIETPRQNRPSMLPYPYARVIGLPPQPPYPPFLSLRTARKTTKDKFPAAISSRNPPKPHDLALRNFVFRLCLCTGDFVPFILFAAD